MTARRDNSSRRNEREGNDGTLLEELVSKYGLGDTIPVTAALPDLDTGTGVDVPLAITTITPDPAYLTGAHFTNEGVNQVTVTVTDLAGFTLLRLKVSPGGEASYNWSNRPAVGVRWLASAVGLKGHIWGNLGS